MRDEQFEFRPRHITSPASLKEIPGTLEKRLPGAVFLDVAKTFDTVWIKCLLYKLTLLHFPSYIVHKISSYIRGRTFRSVLPEGHVISPRHVGWCGLGWIVLPCPLQSVCQRNALTLAPRRVSPLRGRHGHHSHVPQADAARQLPGVIAQRPSTVVE